MKEIPKRPKPFTTNEMGHDYDPAVADDGILIELLIESIFEFYKDFIGNINYSY